MKDKGVNDSVTVERGEYAKNNVALTPDNIEKEQDNVANIMMKTCKNLFLKPLL